MIRNCFLFAIRYWKQCVKKTDFWLIVGFLLVFYSMLSYNSGVYMRSEGGSVGIFSFLPVFSTNRNFILMTLAAYLMLASDMPIRNRVIQFEITRTNKSTWFLGQLLYSFFISVTYALVISILPCVFYIGNVTLQNTWGTAVEDGSAFFADGIITDYDIVLRQSAGGAWIKAFLLFVGLEMLFAMICCLLNLVIGKGYGVTVCSVLIFMELVLGMFVLDWGYFSPVVLLNRFYKDNGANMVPTICYFVTMILALFLLGWRLLRRIDIGIELSDK